MTGGAAEKILDLLRRFERRWVPRLRNQQNRLAAVEAELAILRQKVAELEYARALDVATGRKE